MTSAYPHNVQPVPDGPQAGLDYCTRCHRIEPLTRSADCEEHPDYPHTVVSPAIDIRPGDVIEHVTKPGELMTVHDVTHHWRGHLSVRYRYTANPRGIDWRWFIHLDDQGDVRVLSRGVARVSSTARTFLP